MPIRRYLLDFLVKFWSKDSYSLTFLEFTKKHFEQGLIFVYFSMIFCQNHVLIFLDLFHIFLANLGSRTRLSYFHLDFVSKFETKDSFSLISLGFSNQIWEQGYSLNSLRVSIQMWEQDLLFVVFIWILKLNLGSS